MKSIIVALSAVVVLVSGCALNEEGWQSYGGSTAVSADSDSLNARQSPFPQNNNPPGIY